MIKRISIFNIYRTFLYPAVWLQNIATNQSESGIPEGRVIMLDEPIKPM